MYDRILSGTMRFRIKRQSYALSVAALFRGHPILPVSFLTVGAFLFLSSSRPPPWHLKSHHPFFPNIEYKVGISRPNHVIRNWAQPRSFRLRSESDVISQLGFRYLFYYYYDQGYIFKLFFLILQINALLEVCIFYFCKAQQKRKLGGTGCTKKADFNKFRLPGSITLLINILN